MKQDNQITIYETEDGKAHIEVRFENENVWLTQKQMAELFDTTSQNITQHLKNIYAEGEADQTATCKDFLQVQQEGDRTVKRNASFYSLEAIIAVGYRVNSARGTQFRIWATDKLKSYILKGFALDKDRFIKGSRFSARYFDELLEEIREIRASERMAYQKITDIYATSIDYSPNTADAEKFFAAVQNKLHFAITGQTAAEIIAARADSNKLFMGLTTWRKSPKGKILPGDIRIAKNYLQKEEIQKLNHIVTMYLDYAEFQASRGRLMKMKDWAEKLNAFLKFNEQDILMDKGRISHEVAVALAEKEYELFRIEQDRKYISDFDKIVEKTKRLEKKVSPKNITKKNKQ
ncbi:MAG: cell filamentation protein Fic [Planctomycetes bacterium RBG_16_55_9]|nr:MAG: cell filamentation protein Fic [Planctomycetes bacterium RBG_16_55_9]